MATLTPSPKSFTGRPNASKPFSSFTTDMIHIRHPPTKMLLYHIHIRLSNAWYGLFKGSETLEICIYSSLIVWRQSIDIQ